MNGSCPGVKEKINAPDEFVRSLLICLQKIISGKVQVHDASGGGERLLRDRTSPLP